MPSWVDAAQTASGVSLSKNKSTEPAEATFGFRKRQESHLRLQTPLEIEAMDNEYEATPMGERVAQLYIDPLSADILLEGLEEP